MAPRRCLACRSSESVLAACRRRSALDPGRVETGYRINEALTGNPAGAVAKDAVFAVLSRLR
jgi:hypothetical protein